MIDAISPENEVNTDATLGTLTYSEMINAGQTLKPQSQAELIKQVTEPVATESDAPDVISKPDAPQTPILAPKQEEKPVEQPRIAQSKTVFTAINEKGEKFQLDGAVKVIKKVDGKEVEVPIDLALKDYAFNVPYTKKQQELAEQKRGFESERANWERNKNIAEKNIKTVAAHFKGLGDAIDRGETDKVVEGLAFVLNKPAAHIKANLRRGMIPEIKQFLTADEAEQKRMEVEEKAKFIEQENQKYKSKQTVESSLAQREQAVHQAISQSGISLEDWALAEQQIRQTAPSLKGLTDEEYRYQVALAEQPDFQYYLNTVIAQAKAERQTNTLKEVINEASPNLETEDPEKFTQLFDVVKRYSDYDKDKLLAMIKEHFVGQKKEVEKEEATPISDTPIGSLSTATPEDDPFKDFVFFKR